MKKTMMMLCLAFVSWGAYAQHNHDSHAAQNAQKETGHQMAPMFKDKVLGQAYAHYAELTNALVASDKQKAKSAATELVKYLQAVLDGKKALTAAEQVVAATTLEEQRKAFTSLSNEITWLVQGGKLYHGELYLAYCPMANGNKGGSWLTSEKRIKNPYMGDKMLNCGSVKETIQ